MNPYPDDTFLARWLSNSLNEEERKAFEASPDYGRLIQVLSAMDRLAVPPLDHASLMARVKAGIETEKGRIVQMRKRRIWLSAAAAVIVLLIGTWIALRPVAPEILPMALQTGIGEQEQMALGEGSEVWLNAASELSFKVDDQTGNREAELTGEAHFTVSKGNPFQVKTHLGEINVLGTAFTVFARDSVMRVHCFEGKVWVQTIPGKSDSAHSDTLVKGQSVSYRSGMRLKSAHNRNQPEWMIGLANLKDVPLSEVIAEVERQFHVQIQTVGIDRNEIVDRIFTLEDRDTALEMAFGGKVKVDSISPGVYRLSPLK